MKKPNLSELIGNFKKTFPPRKQTAHKGDFGRDFILAGSRDLCGAGLLAGQGALRAGAGLVSLGTPESCASMILNHNPELMVKPLAETKEGSLSAKAYPEIKKNLEKQDVFALGPGLSQEKETQDLIRQLVKESKVPMVIDADGLNAFQGRPAELKDLKVPVIIPPHAGEFTRLFGVQVSEKESERVEAAQKIAKEFRLTVVLKGAGTVVASPDGRTYVNPTGNPGLAKGGSGDVLCGIVTAFLGQKLDPFEAARWAVFIHGFAADLAIQNLDEISLTAGDLLNYLPRAFQKLLGS